MFDTKGLTEIKMKGKKNGWQGSYFVNDDDICIAKTCFSCRSICAASEFAPANKGRYRLQSQCRGCSRIRMENKRDTVVDGERLGHTMAKLSNDRYKSRSEDEILSDRRRLRPSGTKRCIHCEVSKSFDHFHTANNRADGLRDICTTCAGVYNKDYINREDSDGTKLGALVGRKYKAKLMARTDDEVLLDTLRVLPMGVKKCRSCYSVKLLSDFYHTKYFLDGYTSLCKTCDDARRKDLREREYLRHWDVLGIPLECYICGDPWEHSDHVIAKKRGGSDEPYNRLPICGPCNSSKHMHPLEDWVKSKHPDIADEVLHRVSVLYGMNYSVTSSSSGSSV